MEQQQPARPHTIKHLNLRHNAKNSGNLQRLPASQLSFEVLNLRDKEGYAVALFRWVDG